MEEIASLWSYQENIDELKQKLLYTTLELEAVKAETDERMKRNTESMKQVLQLLKIAYQERDEAKDQLQKLLMKIMPTNDQQIFNPTNPSIPNCFMNDQIQHTQGPLTIPAKANSSITESNSLSDAYNHSSSPVDSFFDPISSPEFSNINAETQFVQDYSVPKVDQATLVMDAMIRGKTLPQKGKLLQTVLEAGPLLQTLLVSGPLPRWRNPPPLQAFHIPPMVAAVDQFAVVQKQDVGSPFKLLLKQSQPYAEMACGSSSQMMVGGGGSGGGGGGGVLSFGDVNFGSNCQGSMLACPGASNFGSIGKRQRLH
ncbi:hypothetical protein L2E82_00784 [Cichorium intybus]|uniref:Uncharacterized protein n=1 Tax=Cichorium intybus TaxID=13427 RepID=A0ACB9GX93_CICIN|nr:hypothetical protein L2E82_00784 [Cichorium intybus]